MIEQKLLLLYPSISIIFQLCPREYREDTVTIVGSILPHDDSVNDRNDGSKLCRSEEITKQLWKGLNNNTFQILPWHINISF